LLFGSAVVKCVVASGHPAFMGGLSPILYGLLYVQANHAENVTNFGAIIIMKIEEIF
jgi:hypothetical protein